MENKSASSSGGIGFFGLLAILFIALKLTNYIDWSWWWVLAPLWGPLAVVVSVLAVWLLCSLLLALFESPQSRRRRDIFRKFDAYEKSLRRR